MVLDVIIVRLSSRQRVQTRGENCTSITLSLTSSLLFSSYPLIISPSLSIFYSFSYTLYHFIVHSVCHASLSTKPSHTHFTLVALFSDPPPPPPYKNPKKRYISHKEAMNKGTKQTHRIDKRRTIKDEKKGSIENKHNKKDS